MRLHPRQEVLRAGAAQARAVAEDVPGRLAVRAAAGGASEGGHRLPENLGLLRVEQEDGVHFADRRLAHVDHAVVTGLSNLVRDIFDRVDRKSVV